MRRALTTILLIAVAAATARAKGFTVVDLGAKGRISQKAFDDLDGDGRAEVILMDGHELKIYVPDAKGKYDRHFPLSYRIAADALYFDVGQVDEREKDREIVLVTPKGVTCRTFRDGKLSEKSRLLIAAENLVTRGQPDNVHWRGFLRDVNGDGLADIVLPTTRGFALFYQRRYGKGESKEHAEGSPGRWTEKPERLLPVTLRASLSIGATGLKGTIHGTVGVPDFRIEDFSGDGENDFAVDDGRRLRIFSADEEGMISQESTGDIDLMPFADSAGNIPPLTIRDLNGDRKLDYLVSHRWQGITDVFLGHQEFTKPALRIRLDGWAFDPRLTDLDGDGRLDLIIPMTPRVGPVAAVKIVATGAITVENHVFLNTGDKEAPFKGRPDKIRKLKVRITPYVDGTGQIRTSHTLLVDYGGDFTGDGRKDLVHLLRSDRLGFFPGVKDGIFADKPALMVDIPDTEDYVWLESAPRDLNGDGKMDMVLFYKSRDRKQDRVVLLIAGE